MPANIIGFAGKKRVGKNTASDYLVKTQNFVELSFAYPLKKSIQAMFGFTDEQMNEKKEAVDDYWGVTPRKVMQIQGTDVVRDLYPSIIFGKHKSEMQSFWILSMEKKIQELEMQHGDANFNIVISDVRFEDEKMFIQKRGGRVIVIKRFEMEEKNSSDTHVSEQMYGFDGCKIIYNNKSIKEFIDQLNLYLP